MKIKVLSLSDSDKHFAPIIQEYSKRLGKSVELIELKPEKYDNISIIIEKETQKIINYLTKHKELPAFYLSINGTSYTSEQFSKLTQEYPQCIFIIGGPYGCNEKALFPYLKGMISFGTMTMPHGLIKSVLIEQIYRASMIQSQRSYHY